MWKILLTVRKVREIQYVLSMEILSRTVTQCDSRGIWQWDVPFENGSGCGSNKWHQNLPVKSGSGMRQWDQLWIKGFLNIYIYIYMYHIYIYTYFMCYTPLVLWKSDSLVVCKCRWGVEMGWAGVWERECLTRLLWACRGGREGSQVLGCSVGRCLL